MLPYRLLAIDIDGTLVNSRDELTAGTRGAWPARQPGPASRCVLATGRRYSRTLHLVEPLAIDVPLVTASGALVKDPLDHRTLLPGPLRAAGAARRGDADRPPGLSTRCSCGDTFAEGFDYYHARRSPARRNWPSFSP